MGVGAPIRPREHTQILNSITDPPSSAHCCRPSQGSVPGRSYTLPILTPGIKKEAPQELSHSLQRKSFQRDGPRQPRPGCD